MSVAHLLGHTVAGTAVVAATVLACCAQIEGRRALRESKEVRARSLETEQRLSALESTLRGRLLTWQMQALSATHAQAERRPSAPEAAPEGSHADQESGPDSASPRLLLASEGTIGRVFARQSIDVGWTRETRWRVLEAVSQNSTTARVSDVDCRERLCRVLLEHASQQEQQELALALGKVPPFDQGTIFDYSTNGTAVQTTLYVARSDGDLLEDER